jgi:hypothetical protein
MTFVSACREAGSDGCHTPWLCKLSAWQKSRFLIAKAIRNDSLSGGSSGRSIAQNVRWADADFRPSIISRLPFPRSSNRFSGLAVCSTAAFGLAFVPQLLAFGQRQFHLHATILEIHSYRDQRLTLLLRLTN